jgi:hypothetical protein
VLWAYLKLLSELVARKPVDYTSIALRHGERESGSDPLADAMYQGSGEDEFVFELRLHNSDTLVGNLAIHQIHEVRVVEFY